MTFTPSLTIVRTIAAPIDRVFAAWTDPTLLQRWLAPAPCEVVEAEANARPGGTYRLVIADPSGQRVTTSGEYREVVPEVRLVQTWVYQSDAGGDPAVEAYPTLLTVEFRALDAGTTELTLRHDQLLTPEDQKGNREGWRLCLNQLEILLR